MRKTMQDQEVDILRKSGRKKSCPNGQFQFFPRAPVVSGALPELRAAHICDTWS